MYSNSLTTYFSKALAQLSDAGVIRGSRVEFTRLDLGAQLLRFTTAGFLASLWTGAVWDSQGLCSVLWPTWPSGLERCSFLECVTDRILLSMRPWRNVLSSITWPMWTEQLLQIEALVSSFAHPKSLNIRIPMQWWLDEPQAYTLLTCSVFFIL